MSARDLLASGAGITLIDEQIITVSGNWTKVAAVKPTDRVIVHMWSGGGAGALSAQSGDYVGGQGGWFAELEFFAYELPSTVPGIVGSGGIAPTVDNNNGGDGGSSSFGGFSIPGGAGGLYNMSGTGIAHTRKMELLSGVSMLIDINQGGGTYPNLYAPTPNPKVKIEAGGFWLVSYSGSTYYLNVADRVYAGACGGSLNRTTYALRPPGKSIFGGAGGAALAYNNNGDSSDGSVPGGGGGSKCSVNGRTGRPGNGARGEIRVRVLRGAS